MWNTETAKTEEVSNNWCEADQEESFGQQSVEYGRRMACSMADNNSILRNMAHSSQYGKQRSSEYGIRQNVVQAWQAWHITHKYGYLTHMAHYGTQHTEVYGGEDSMIILH